MPTEKTQRRGRLIDDPAWPMIVRDYVAGDTQLTLQERYGWPQQSIARALRRMVIMRTGALADTIRSQQIREADEVRYRLRTGDHVDRAAVDLGVDSDELCYVLERYGLILHDYHH